MLSRLNGILIEKQPPYVLLEVQGVGYEIQMPMICFYQLPEIGQPAVILTHFWVREEAQLLYGFCSQPARALFRALVKVSGVGPKLALAILSGLSASQFIQAVEQGDISVLVKLPGVGKKTAERLLVEMRDRCQKLDNDTLLATQFTAKNSSTDNPLFKQSAQQEAIAALITLGYKPSQASHMIQQVAQSHAAPVACETLIRQALRQL